MNEQEKLLEKILNEIEKNLEADGSWVLSAESAGRITGCINADLFSRLYEIKEKHGLELVTDEFNNDTVPELLLFLELRGFGKAEEFLVKAGFYLNYNMQEEVYNSFISVIKRKTESHTIDFDQFLFLNQRNGDPRITASLYLEKNFDRESLMHSACCEYADAGNFTYPESAIRSAEDYLRLLFIRHIISWEQFFYRIIGELLDFYYSVYSCDSRDGSGFDDIPEIVRTAMKIFRISDRQMERDILRKKYRELIKKFHPDINKAGEEQTKQLIKAYAVLSSYLD